MLTAQIAVSFANPTLRCSLAQRAGMPVEKTMNGIGDQAELGRKNGIAREWRDLIKILPENPLGVGGLLGSVARTCSRSSMKGNQATSQCFPDVRRKLTTLDQRIEHTVGRQQPHERRPFNRFSFAAKSNR